MKNINKNKISKYLLSLIAVAALSVSSLSFGVKLNIWQAIVCNSVDVATKLIEGPNFDVNQVDILGWTPLHLACLEGRLEIARLLIEKGANVNQADNGQTPLNWACRYGNLEVVKFLLENGADIDQNSIKKVQKHLQDRKKTAEEKAIATQILAIFNLTQRFDKSKKSGSYFDSKDDIKDNDLRAFRDRLIVSRRAKLKDAEYKKNSLNLLSKKKGLKRFSDISINSENF